jgi:hypothetical protein
MSTLLKEVLSVESSALTDAICSLEDGLDRIAQCLDASLQPATTLLLERAYGVRLASLPVDGRS